MDWGALLKLVRSWPSWPWSSPRSCWRWPSARCAASACVPPNADFFTTVRAVPLSLVVGLDLLDLALDVFSAPIIWFILNRFGLQALRNVATVEALIPITGPIPTLTLAWLAARASSTSASRYDPDLIETRADRTGQLRAAPALRPRRR